jgi:SH3-like domain-containing protein
MTHLSKRDLARNFAVCTVAGFMGVVTASNPKIAQAVPDCEHNWCDIQTHTRCVWVNNDFNCTKNAANECESDTC